MKKLTGIITIPIVLVSLAVAAGASADTVPRKEPKQWKIQRASGLAGETTARSDTKYGLSNDVQKGWLSYDQRDGSVPYMKGEQWQFVAYWEFHKRQPSANVRDHRARPVEANEKVALSGINRQYSTSRGTRKGEYLVANPGSKSGPGGTKWIRDREKAYEWTVEIDPATKRMSLYNTRVKRYLGLPIGGSIAWIATGQTPQPPVIHDATVTMTAQPVTQGFVPFLGYFGGGSGFNSVLTEVRNPANGAFLSFVKPGHSTTECGNPGAIIQLAPGAALTGAQMQTIWNSSTPSLTQRLPFLACAATPLSSVFVNVKYRDL